MPRIRSICASRSTIGGRACRRTADVDHARGQFAAGQFENQLARPAAGPIDRFGIDAALEAVRRIAVQVELARRVADRDRVELGRFDQDIRRSRPNFRIGAAHHAAQAHRARPIGNDAHARFKLVGLVVDGHEIARAGRASRTTISRPSSFGQVKRVQRLAALHQHVIGHIDHVVDRRNADASSADRPASAGWP